MGFLAPLFLLAAGAVAVPLLLHLFHRHDSRRFSFPALRYLQRTEKEHARRIRLRQLLLLFLRMSAIVVIVLAGSRLFVRGSGSGHEPTAVAVILDNSMSSGLVVGEERVLDQLKRLALESVAQATSDDRIWVIRAGEPWDAAPPGGPAQAHERIGSTEVSTAAGDLSATLARARELLLASGLPAREIHLLSDLQASAFPQGGEPGPAGELPVIVYRSGTSPPNNLYLEGLSVGGGLPPLAGQRTEISVTVGASDASLEVEVPLRLVIEDRIHGAASALPGRAVTLPVGPFPEGLVQGYIETDSDALRADDRRYFAFRVRPPPAVALSGGGAFFLEQALAVLEESGRLRRGGAGSASVLFSVAGEGIETLREGQAAVLFPPSDPALLPAMNRRLAQAGLPWRVEQLQEGGEAEPRENRMPVDLSGVRVHRRYTLEPVGDEEVAADVVVALSNGEPWMTAGTASGRPYLLVASPLDPEWSTLPVSAAMVPLLEWMTSLGAAGEPAVRRTESGQDLPLPGDATHVRAPDGTVHPVDQGAPFRETREAGVYEVLQDDRVLEHVAVGPPVRESLLAPLAEGAVGERIGSDVRVVVGSQGWGRRIFVNRQGPELWRPLLLLALALLFVEAWIAAPGRTGRARRTPTLQAPESDRREVRATVS